MLSSARKVRRRNAQVCCRLGPRWGLRACALALASPRNKALRLRRRAHSKCERALASRSDTHTTSVLHCRRNSDELGRADQKESEAGDERVVAVACDAFKFVVAPLRDLRGGGARKQRQSQRRRFRRQRRTSAVCQATLKTYRPLCCLLVVHARAHGFRWRSFGLELPVAVATSGGNLNEDGDDDDDD